MHPSFILGGSASRVVLMNTHQVIFLLFFVHRNRILMNVSVKFAFSVLNMSAVIPENPEMSLTFQYQRGDPPQHYDVAEVVPLKLPNIAR